MVIRDHSQLFDEMSATGLEVDGLIPFDSNYLQLHPGVQFCVALRGITTKDLVQMGSLPWFLLGLPSTKRGTFYPSFSEHPKMKWEDLKK